MASITDSGKRACDRCKTWVETGSLAPVELAEEVVWWCTGCVVRLMLGDISLS